MTAAAAVALVVLAVAATDLAAAATAAAQDEWTQQLPASHEATETAAVAMGSDDTAPHGLTVSHWQGPGLLAAVRRGDRPGAPARAARAAHECPLEACAG